MTVLTHLLQVKHLLFEPGDSMGQEEFLSRWERMPELRFAELIKGMVYMPSPVSAAHRRKHGVLLAWTALYAGRATFVEILPEATWLMEESAPHAMWPSASSRTLEDRVRTPRNTSLVPPNS